MNYRESISVGLQGLITHRMRSLLTALGIIFGVGAVIAMLSIGEGAKREALEQIALMGIDNIIVQDIPLESEMGEEERSTLSQGLTLSDARAVSLVNPLIGQVTPQKEYVRLVMYESEQINGNIIATTPEYENVMDIRLRMGSFFNFDDLNTHRRVCVIGNGVRQDLFFFKNPLGRRIKISDQWFTVIGVMEEMHVGAGKAGLKIRNMNNDIYVPLATARKRFTMESNESEIDQIIMQVEDTRRIREAANIVNKIVSRRHNGVKDFQIVIPEELLRQSQRTQRIFNIVMGAIAGISLLVGGIGIMNIMLATVLERTREIGIRRAVGATQRDIMGQFLVEALVISFAGGMIGIVIGYALTEFITSYAGWKTIVSTEAVLLAFGVSATVGVIFGFYPAKKAALLDPIESLRYE